jgi:hypothetical protein
MPSPSQSPWFGTSWNCTAACLSVLSFRLQILGSPASIKITIFWDVTPSSVVVGIEHLGKTAGFFLFPQAACCSESLVPRYQTTRRRIPED